MEQLEEATDSFSNCPSLQFAIIPNIKKLDDFCFANSSLKAFESQIKFIGCGVFYASKLKAVIVNKCESFGSKAFFNCPQLELVEALTVGVIKTFCFQKCDKMKYFCNDCIDIKIEYEGFLGVSNTMIKSN